MLFIFSFLYIRKNKITKRIKTMSTEILKSIGYVAKKEDLASVEYDTKSSALVMESLFPFPGYNGTTVPDRTDPRSLFFVTEKEYKDDEIIRAIRNVKKDFSHHFDGTPGIIELYNIPSKVVRIKYLAYDKINSLVKAFEDNGIKFQSDKRISQYPSIIKITKYFKLQPSSEGIYNDTYWKGMYYLQLPVGLKWKDFEKITMSIKHNIEDNNFDAALTTMYSEDGVLDFVRIYDEDCCQGKLMHIREKYIEAIKYI